MKIKVNKFDMSLMDNGDWEYDRIGLKKKDGKVYVCDVESGEEGEGYDVLGVSEKEMSEVVKIGVECGVFVEYEKGYDESDKVRVNGEVFEGDEEWKQFLKKI